MPYFLTRYRCLVSVPFKQPIFHIRLDVFSSTQPRHVIYKLQCFVLMMEMQLVSEMMEFINHLTRLSGRENFIEHISRNTLRFLLSVRRSSTINVDKSACVVSVSTGTTAVQTVHCWYSSCTELCLGVTDLKYILLCAHVCWCYYYYYYCMDNTDGTKQNYKQ